MATQTLEQLLAAESQDQIKARLLAAINPEGFPATDWNNFAYSKAILEMMALGFRDLIGNLVPKIASGRFLRLAAALKKSDGSEERGWMRLLADENYDLLHTEATHTIQKCELSCDASNGPYNVVAGQLIAESTAGRRYRNKAGGTIPTGGKVTLDFESESPQDSTSTLTDYVDEAGSITKLVTPLPGVTINNPAPEYSDVIVSGDSTGTIALSTPSPPAAAKTYKITIVTAGQVGAGSATYEDVKDAPGVQVSLGATIPTTFDFPNGTRATFSNGAANPSFRAGDTFEFSTPGSPISQQGRDEENNAALAARCRARWPSLSDTPTASKHELWAKEASTQVTKVRVKASTTVPGQADVTIAGQVNPLDGSVVTTVQNFIDAREGILDKTVVAAASAVNIQVSGQVTVPVGKSAAIKTQADALWSSYIAALLIGGRVKLAMLRSVVLDAALAAGVAKADINMEDLAITGANVESPPVDSSANVDQQLGATEVAAIASGQNLSAALSWFEE